MIQTFSSWPVSLAVQSSLCTFLVWHLGHFCIIVLFFLVQFRYWAYLYNFFHGFSLVMADVCHCNVSPAPVFAINSPTTHYAKNTSYQTMLPGNSKLYIMCFFIDKVNKFKFVTLLSVLLAFRSHDIHLLLSRDMFLYLLIYTVFIRQ